MPSRYRVTCLALGVTVVLLAAGCGGSSHKASAPAVLKASPSVQHHQPKLTDAEYREKFKTALNFVIAHCPCDFKGGHISERHP
jgi:hypothetical protein